MQTEPSLLRLALFDSRDSIKNDALKAFLLNEGHEVPVQATYFQEATVRILSLQSFGIQAVIVSGFEPDISAEFFRRISLRNERFEPKTKTVLIDPLVTSWNQVLGQNYTIQEDEIGAKLPGVLQEIAVAWRA